MLLVQQSRGPKGAGHFTRLSHNLATIFEWPCINLPFYLPLLLVARCALTEVPVMLFYQTINKKQKQSAPARRQCNNELLYFFLSGVVRQNVLQPQHIDHHHLGDHQMHQVAGPGMDPGVGPGAPHVPNGGGVMKVRM